MSTRDFMHVDTLTGIICDAIDRGVISPEPVNLAFGIRTNLLDLVADRTQLLELFPDVSPTAFDASLRSTVDWFRAGCP